jgi:prophage regulatory protein
VKIQKLHLKGLVMKDSSPRSTAPLIQQTQTALIRRREVERLTALSRSRIYALMATGSFPKPVVLGAMSVAWLEVEVRAWIASRIAARKEA